MRALLILLMAMALGGCQASEIALARSDTDSGPWALGFITPNLMDVWVEDAATVDIDGNLYRRIGSGWVVEGGKKDGSKGVKGWSVTAGGNQREVLAAKLPVRIYVRWQSVAEPQTYDGWFEIPETARQILRDSLAEECPTHPEMREIRTAAQVKLGLAPGGIVQVWVLDKCMKPVNVAHGKAAVVSLGPAIGRSGGNYFPQSEESKRYVEKHGIPYGSWD